MFDACATRAGILQILFLDSPEDKERAHFQFSNPASWQHEEDVVQLRELFWVSVRWPEPHWVYSPVLNVLV